PDAEKLEADWYRRTGIYPMHGTIVVKDSVLKEHPWVARSLADAFEAAKNEWLAQLRARQADTAAQRQDPAQWRVGRGRPLPNGLAANMPTIRALEDTAFKQKLTPRRMTIEELFVDPK